MTSELSNLLSELKDLGLRDALQKAEKDATLRVQFKDIQECALAIAIKVLTLDGSCVDEDFEFTMSHTVPWETESVQITTPVENGQAARSAEEPSTATAIAIKSTEMTPANEEPQKDTDQVQAPVVPVSEVSDPRQVENQSSAAPLSASTQSQPEKNPAPSTTLEPNAANKVRRVGKRKSKALVSDSESDGSAKEVALMVGTRKEAKTPPALPEIHGGTGHEKAALSTASKEPPGIHASSAPPLGAQQATTEHQASKGPKTAEESEDEEDGLMNVDAVSKSPPPAPAAKGKGKVKPAEKTTIGKPRKRGQPSRGGGVGESAPDHTASSGANPPRSKARGKNKDVINVDNDEVGALPSIMVTRKRTTGAKDAEEIKESTVGSDDASAPEPKKRRIKQEKPDNGEGSSRTTRATQDPPPPPYPKGPRRKDGKKTYTDPPPPPQHRWKYGETEYMLRDPNTECAVCIANKRDCYVALPGRRFPCYACKHVGHNPCTPGGEVQIHPAVVDVVTTCAEFLLPGQDIDPTSVDMAERIRVTTQLAGVQYRASSLLAVWTAALQEQMDA